LDDFEIIGPIEAIEVIASGNGIRELRRLIKSYGAGRWRKLKGVTRVRAEAREGFGARKYTGTKHTASANEK
jgi:hypothetical protein